jgi:hypothetical protein
MTPTLELGLLLLHLTSTAVMTGVIWTVQLVHYPLMALVGTDRFVVYEAAHAPRMAGVVLVPWVAQGLSTAWLVMARPAGVAPGLIAAAALAAATTVLVTMAFSVPAHRRLAAGFDTAAHARLVRTNWLRTAAWTTHMLIAAAILADLR